MEFLIMEEYGNNGKKHRNIDNAKPSGQYSLIVNPPVDPHQSSPSAPLAVSTDNWSE